MPLPNCHRCGDAGRASQIPSILIQRCRRFGILCLLGSVTSLALAAPAAGGELPARQGRPAGAEMQRLWWGRPARPISPTQIGKNHGLVRGAFGQVVKAANRYTVRVMSQERQIALGTIVTTDGLVLTKASELDGPLRCKVPGQGEFVGEQVAGNEEFDLALIKLKDVHQPLPAIPWEDTHAESDIGSWVAVPAGFGEDPLVVGVISARERAIRRDSAVLGIVIEDKPEGVVVVQVVPSSGADLAGVSNGDVVTHIDRRQVSRQRELIREVRKHTPGDRIQLQLRRGDQSLVVNPTLGRDQEIAMIASGQLDHHNGQLSDRRSGFPLVMQHDCVLRADQCGGPLLNLDGQVIGFNIARAGRVATYAISLPAVAATVHEMIAGVPARAITPTTTTPRLP